MTIKQSRFLAKKAIELNKVFPFFTEKKTINDLAPQIRQAGTVFADAFSRVVLMAIEKRAGDAIFEQANELATLAYHPDFIDFMEA